MDTKQDRDVNMEPETKPWWKSKAILGGVAAMIAGVVGLSVEDTAQLENSLTSIASAIGGILSIYGRVKAEKPIK